MNRFRLAGQPAAFQVIVLSFVLIACMLLLDRPVALLCFRAFGQTPLRFLLDRYLLPFEVLASLFLAPFFRGRHLIAAALAAVVSLAASVMLKALIGRSRPDPVFLFLHEYGFHPLHASLWWDSFPSSTAAVACALISVLVLAQRRIRITLIALTSTLCLFVLLANAHWLSDILAGAWLGTACGRIVFARVTKAKTGSRALAPTGGQEREFLRKL